MISEPDSGPVSLCIGSDTISVVKSHEIVHDLQTGEETL